MPPPNNLKKGIGISHCEGALNDDYGQLQAQLVWLLYSNRDSNQEMCLHIVVAAGDNYNNPTRQYKYVVDNV
eukprot:3844671-Amphidinium_carterae.1